MNRRALVFGPLAFGPVAVGLLSATAHAAPTVKVVYIGGWDCPPCMQWKNAYKAEWLTSPEFQRVQWIEVESPRLKQVYEERFWPGDLKPILDQIPRKSGTPRFLIVRKGKIVSNEFGVGRWSATMADLKKYLE